MKTCLFSSRIRRCQLDNCVLKRVLNLYEFEFPSGRNICSIRPLLCKNATLEQAWVYLTPSKLDAFIRTFVATLELLFNPQNGLLRDILCKYVNPLDATLKLMQKASFNPMLISNL